MSLTGAQLLQGFSEWMGDYWSSTTTSAGASDGTTLVDTSLRRFGDDFLRNFYLRPTGAANQYAIRRISTFASSSGTCTVAPAFAAQAPTSQDYELHRYDPAEKFKALDAARIRVVDDLFQIIEDESITGDGRRRVFDIPSTMRRGPSWVYQEVPVEVEPDWNWVSDPEGDSTTNWTASGTTASTYDHDDADLLIPKYPFTCTKLVTAASQAATYTQTVGSMTNGASASIAADRLMTFGAWVYCTETTKVRVGITDDTGTTYSSYHGGNGWELLTLEKTIDGDNSTTLSVLFDIASTANPSTIFWNRAWFYLGDSYRITEIYDLQTAHRVQRDSTLQRIVLPFVPERGHQLRLVGKDVLSALGTTAATQVTNTMEVDEENAPILYAEAADILMTRIALNVDDAKLLAAKIAEVRNQKEKHAIKWAMAGANRRRARGMWAK